MLFLLAAMALLSFELCFALDCQVSSTTITATTPGFNGGVILSTCVTINYTNVVFDGAILITSTVSDTAGLSVRFSNIELKNSACLKILGVVDSDAMTSAAARRQVLVEDLVATNSSVLVQGRFPPNTTLQMSRMNISAGTSAPALVVPLNANGITQFCLVLLKVQLFAGSTLNIMDSRLVGESSAGSLLLTDVIQLVQSSLLILNTTIFAVREALLVSSCNLTLTDFSRWIMRSCTINSSINLGIALVDLTSVGIVTSSLWDLDNSSIYGRDRAFMLCQRCSIVLQDRSVFSVRRSSMAGINDCFAVGGKVIVADFSTWSISEYSSRNLSRSGGSGFALLDGHEVRLYNTSSWAMSDSFFNGFYAGIFFSGSTVAKPKPNIVISMNSTWSIRRSAVSGMSSLFAISSALEVINSSMWILENSTFRNAAAFTDNIIRVTRNSVWLIYQCRFDTFQFTNSGPQRNLLLEVADNSSWQLSFTNFTAISFLVSFSFTNWSRWKILSCTCETDGDRPPLFARLELNITESSAFVIDSSAFKATKTLALSFGNGDAPTGVNVLDGSCIHFLNLTVATLSTAYAAFIMFFVTLVIRRNSTYIFEGGSYVSGSAAMNTAYSSILLDDGSSFVVRDARLTGEGPASLAGLAVASSVVKILNGSLWLVTSSTITHQGFSGGAVAFAMTQLTIENSSEMTLSNCKMTSSSVALGLLQTAVIISGNSSWRLLICSLQSSSDSTFQLGLDTLLEVRGNSEWIVRNSTIIATGPSSISVALSGLSITVAGMSLMLWSGLDLRSENAAIAYLVSSTVVCSTFSAFVVDDSVMTVSPSSAVLSATEPRARSAIRFASTSTVIIANYSWMRLNSVNVRYGGKEPALCACVRMTGRLRVLSFGVLSFANIFCDGFSNTAGAFEFPSSFSPDGTGAMHHQCNLVSGAAAPRSSFPRSAVSASCDVCDFRISCFVPLTVEPAQVSKTTCNPEKPLRCPCSPGCGGTSACLPGRPACQARARRPLYGSLSQSVTSSVSEEATASATVEFPPNSPVRSDLSRAAIWTGAASIVASGGAPASSHAGTLQRIFALQRLSQCGTETDTSETLDIPSSPTQLCFGPTEGRCLRGAVMGNVAVLAGFAAVAVVVTVAAAHIRRQSREEVAASFGLPGLLWKPYTMLSLPTMTSSVTLLGATTSRADRIVALVGLAVVFAPFTVLVVLTTRRFAGKCVRNPLHQQQLTPRLPAILSYVFEPPHHWASRDGSFFVEMWETLFEDYVRGRPWFGVLDTVCSFFTALLTGMVSDDPAICQRLLIAATVVSVFYLGSLAVLWPYAARLDTALSLLNAPLAVAISVSALTGGDFTHVATAAVVLSSAGTFISLAYSCTSHFRSEGEKEPAEIRRAWHRRSRCVVHVPDEVVRELLCLDGSNPHAGLARLVEVICTR
jgi:hypothetical protein